MAVENLINMARGWAIAAPGANTDVLASSVTWPSQNPCLLTIQVATATVVNLMVTRGGVTKALGLNAIDTDPSLVAGYAYSFMVPGLLPGDLVNVQVETDTAIDMLSLDEVAS